METGKVKGITKFSIALGFLGQALLTGLVDGITDILMGAVIDRTKSKQGKARPWIIRAIVPSVLFTILLFSTPGTISGTAKIVFIFVMYNLYALAYTALGCAMSTLNVRLTRNEKEINTISTLIMFGSILGNTLINAVAVSVLTALSGGSNQYTRTAFIEFAVILGVICLVGTLLTYFTTTEIKDTEDTQDGQKKSGTNTKKSILALLKNKYWIMQLINTVCVYLGLYTRLAVMIY